MANLDEILHSTDVSSPFVLDVVSSPESLNTYNAIYNLEPEYQQEGVLLSGFKPSESRNFSRQLIEEISLRTFRQVSAVVVKDSYPIASGHVMLVPVKRVNSFHQYVLDGNVTPDQLTSTQIEIAQHLQIQSQSSGFDCKQVIFFEHGSGFVANEPEVFNACGSKVQLCNEVIHAHLHALPVLEDRNITCDNILQVAQKIMGDFYFLFLQCVKELPPDAIEGLENKPYFSMRIIEFIEGKPIIKDLTIVPSDELLKVLPPQLWRKLLVPLVSPSIGIDLSDYKKLAGMTVRDLRSERVISALRTIHDRFWNPTEL